MTWSSSAAAAHPYRTCSLKGNRMLTRSSWSQLAGGAVAEQTILVVDGEPLSRDCLAEALSRAFRPAQILAVSDICELAPSDVPVEHLLIVIKCAHGTICSPDQEVSRVAKHYPDLPIAVIAAWDEQVMTA